MSQSPSGSVIYLLGPAHPYRGGLAAFNERLAQELQARGHEVVLYTFTLQYPRFLFPGKTQFSDSPAPANLTIERQIHALNPFNWLRVGLRLRRRRPTAVIAAFWLPLMGPCLGTILLLARSRYTRALGLVHNLIPHEKRPGDKWLSRYFAHAAHGFIAMSQSVADDIHSFVPQRPVVYAPHPVYDNYGQPVGRTEALAFLKLPPETDYLLFFGFIRDYKGLDLLLYAMADPRIKTRPLRLIIAGEFYGNEAYYHQLIDELGLNNQLVLHTDFIPDEAVKYYFGAADLVVQPYRSATQSGISQLAYHFGVPMVVTRVGGLPEIVPHGQAGYVTDIDPTAIADAIVDFYDNQRASRLREGVQQLRHRYSWAALASQIETLIRKH